MLHEKGLFFLAILGVLALLCAGSPAVAQDAPDLGTTKTFAVLGATTVTNTGASVLSGDLGIFPGTSITGFPPGVVENGTIHAADAVAQQAQNDLTTAYNNFAGQPCGTHLTGQDLGGLTLVSGVYCFDSSAQLTGTLTLDAQGDPNAVFIFQIGSTLTTASNSSVEIINGGSSCNVFWQVGSSAILGTTTSFAGSILALASITLNTGANVSGRLLAQNGAVTLDTNEIDAPLCVNPATLPSGQQTVFYSATITATGGAGTHTFAVTDGALPDGLTLSSAGLLSGTPTASGTWTFTITATDDGDVTGARAYRVTIAGATATAIPTLSTWGPLLLMALTGLVSTRYLKRSA